MRVFKAVDVVSTAIDDCRSSRRCRTGNHHACVLGRILPLATLLLCILGLPGCGETTRGEAFLGSQAIPGSNIQNCYVVQYRFPDSAEGSQARQPVYAILWQGTTVGVVKRSHANWVTAIHGYPLSIDQSHNAVYALQPDYSLRELPLGPSDQQWIFSAIRSETAKQLAKEQFWQDRIAPQLHQIEAAP